MPAVSTTKTNLSLHAVDDILFKKKSLVPKCPEFAGGRFIRQMRDCPPERANSRPAQSFVDPEESEDASGLPLR